MTVDLHALRNTIEELLSSRGVFDIDSFGWVNEEEVDPEFVGYAMWAQSPPYDHDFDSWQNNRPPGRAPTQAEQQQMELGHDFFGLMKTARHFIGHALLHQPAVLSLDIEPSSFDFNVFGALVALTAAADRLSDFIIVTTLRRKPNRKAKKQYERTKAYEKLRAAEMASEADALEKGFEAVDQVRKARNKVVHALATAPAHAERFLIAAERKVLDEKRWDAAGNRQAPPGDVIYENEESADAEARAKLLCDCYVKLIKMGDLSFRVEHDWRQRQQS
jgi:hypothetical protein